MVRITKYRNRYAFTMIELIFAIVIIAISVMSLPMMTQVTGKGIENSLLQEAIFAGSAELMGATTAYWDERSLEDVNVSSLSRVIDTLGDCNATTRLRAGHIAQPYHRRCVDSLSAIGLSATADANITSLDDMIKANQDVFLNMNPDASGYKDTYTSTIGVALANNIKTITVIIRKVDDDSNVTVLKTQSANIGEIDYFKRTF